MKRAIPYMNAGRWVVDCPDPDCPGAGLARHVYVCRNCNRITKVVWPTERVEVDHLVEVRPVPDTRNWRGPWNPTEPVDDLRRENAAHGLDSA